MDGSRWLPQGAQQERGGGLRNSKGKGLARSAGVTSQGPAVAGSWEMGARVWPDGSWGQLKSRMLLVGTVGEMPPTPGQCRHSPQASLGCRLARACARAGGLPQSRKSPCQPPHGPVAAVTAARIHSDGQQGNDPQAQWAGSGFWKHWINKRQRLGQEQAAPLLGTQGRASPDQAS